MTPHPVTLRETTPLAISAYGILWLIEQRVFQATQGVTGIRN